MDPYDEYCYMDEFEAIENGSGLALTPEDDEKLSEIWPKKVTTPIKEIKHGEVVSKEMLDFAPFSLRPELMKALQVRQFCRPSPAQATGLPVALSGVDLLLQSKEGSGKTAVYCLGALQMMKFGCHIETLVIVPTRELAVQVAAEFQAFADFLPECRVESLYGGVLETRDRIILTQKQPNIVVGTPGRLVSLLQNRQVNLRWVTHFIVDECDKLLNPDEEMSHHVRALLDACPEERQVMMFTGTINRTEAERERRFLKLMHCPRLLLVDDPNELILTGVLQYRVSLDSEARKTRKLLDLLDRIDYNQVVIFVNTIERCHYLCDLLNEQGLGCIPFHSYLSQVERLKQFNAFKNFFRRILVATDLMGRGIDYEFVTCVINYDVPITSEIYLHRVGRTGRMQRRGLAVTLTVLGADSDVNILNEVEKQHFTCVQELPDDLSTSIFSESDPA